MLTIGFATYSDFDGIYFTLNSLKLHHSVEDCEILVVDNNPSWNRAHEVKRLCEYTGAKYIPYGDNIGIVPSRNKIIEEASNDYILICDGHVLFEQRSIQNLKNYYKINPDYNGLLFGVISSHANTLPITHLQDYWHRERWGIPGFDSRGLNPHNSPFSIPAGSGGCFSFKKSEWLGYNPNFVGYGGEEHYICIKYHQNGRPVLCHPGLRCIHRYERETVPFPLTQLNKVRNYAIGLKELGMSLDRLKNHFVYRIPEILENGQKTQPALAGFPEDVFNLLEQDPLQVEPILSDSVKNRPCVRSS